MKIFARLSIIALFLTAGLQPALSQNYLKTNGKAIVNEAGDTIILRAMGLGGWMLQEGYMLQTGGFASAQYQIKARIEALIGKTDADLFYEAWLSNHVRKIDIDSLKSWGFNAVRLPMHYNLFTLPIESEPVMGVNTWLEKGFALTDSLVKWCAANEMYVILDLHAAPGGQGYEQGISDYNPAKPSLWESTLNKNKTIALWKKLAERYAGEQWIGGYDLINETNWNMSGNADLKSLYSAIADAIRLVDTKHILFIEGNWFANDFTGLVPPFKTNIVYSPHKYWSYNDKASIQWVLDIRDTYNVPIWFGEAGENSNTWFRDAIRLFEDNGIGWAWWPMKKVESISGPLSVIKTADYQSLLNYWSGTGPAPSAAVARATLMDLADKFKLENCVYQKDVIDAMFRQVRSNETVPYATNNIPGIIYASDFDMGVAGHAYHDADIANYNVSTGNYTAWNKGWMYRNDGVDIESTTDVVNSNGFNVGWIETGEWMQYTVNVTTGAIFDIVVRIASAEANGKFHLESGGSPVTSINNVPNTGGWKTWSSILIPNIIITPEDKKIRLYVDSGVFNLISLQFIQKGATTTTPASLIAAVTLDDKTIKLSYNKPLAGPMPAAPASFTITSNGIQIPVTAVTLDPDNNRVVTLSLGQAVRAKETVKVSYSGTSILAKDGTSMAVFTLRDVINKVRYYHPVPGRIQAEDFDYQVGVQLESTTDIGGGQNIGYLDVGDYLDYYINIQNSGTFNVAYRTASANDGGGLQMELIDSLGKSSVLHSATFPATGGWQTWATTNRSAYLKSGLHHIRLKITKSQFNVNWFEFSVITGINDAERVNDLKIFPNPADGLVFLTGSIRGVKPNRLEVLNSMGKRILIQEVNSVEELNETIDTGSWPNGLYFVSVRFTDGSVSTIKLLKSGR